MRRDALASFGRFLVVLMLIALALVLGAYLVTPQSSSPAVDAANLAQRPALVPTKVEHRAGCPARRRSGRLCLFDE